MIPYYSQPVFHLGPLPIHMFGILVATGIFVGMTITLKRAAFEGLDPRVDEDLIWYAVLIGFISAHVFDLVAYDPQRIIDDPLSLVKIWDGISSFGGMLGGLLGMVWFFWRKTPGMSLATRLRYVDTIAFGWPFAWVFGRSGCTVAIDHPGTITSFPLAISLKTEAAQDKIRYLYEAAGKSDLLPADLSSLGFHNLGLYEMLYTLLVIVPVWLLLARKRRAPGFWLALFFLLYVPVRFGLDFLRMADARYLGLTPAQYASVIGAIIAAWVLANTKKLQASEA
jgi:phosphatidylglycerol:prolipoprotein diacylglycerol transferase